MNTSAFFNTENISNSDCHKYFSKILRKLFLAINKEQKDNFEDYLKYGIAIINKIRLQYSSVELLTYRDNPDDCMLMNTITDISSINVLIRAIFENCSLFHFIYIDEIKTKRILNLSNAIFTSKEFIIYKYNLFNYNSNYQLNTEPILFKREQIKYYFEKSKEKLENDTVFKKLNKNNQNNILKNGQKPKWESIISVYPINNNFAKWEYNILSLDNHSSENAVNRFTYFHNNQDILNKDALLFFLFIILSSFVFNAINFFNVSETILTQDERNLLNEFIYIGNNGNEVFNFSIPKEE